MIETKTYGDLLRFSTFEERFRYLKIGGIVGRSTFGFDRHLNQAFYQSLEWRAIREKVLSRDEGCDLGIQGREVFARPVVHHITPISIDDVQKGHDNVFDLDNLVCTSHVTHNAIHYGDESLLIKLPKAREKGDTCPWKKAF